MRVGLFNCKAFSFAMNFSGSFVRCGTTLMLSVSMLLLSASTENSVPQGKASLIELWLSNSSVLVGQQAILFCVIKNISAKDQASAIALDGLLYEDDTAVTNAIGHIVVCPWYPMQWSQPGASITNVTTLLFPSVTYPLTRTPLPEKPGNYRLMVKPQLLHETNMIMWVPSSEIRIRVQPVPPEEQQAYNIFRRREVDDWVFGRNRPQTWEGVSIPERLKALEIPAAVSNAVHELRTKYPDSVYTKQIVPIYDMRFLEFHQESELYAPEKEILSPMEKADRRLFDERYDVEGITKANRKAYNAAIDGPLMAIGARQLKGEEVPIDDPLYEAYAAAEEKFVREHGKPLPPDAWERLQRERKAKEEAELDAWEKRKEEEEKGYPEEMRTKWKKQRQRYRQMEKEWKEKLKQTEEETKKQ
ncbi:MAG: hypothetical protein HY360_18450 [Verrucomicrobia bacterium]|nr:hypothetical protein [Verrucomicrobiota bacterium]